MVSYNYSRSYGYAPPVVHYGVLGMKWGVRRSPEQLAKKKARDEDRQIKKERREASKNRRSLSDKDLQDRVNRLTLEKKLKDLTDNDVNQGRVVAREVVSRIGTTVVTSAVIGTLAYAGHAALTGRLDPLEAASYIFPNPNRKKK